MDPNTPMPPAGDGSPNLSQYFANDPPSCFDELGSNKETVDAQAQHDRGAGSTSSLSAPAAATRPPPTSAAAAAAIASASVSGASLTAQSFTGSFKPVEYIENATELEDELKVSDDVRNHWEMTPPDSTTEQQPILLTMPGVQLQNRLPDRIAEEVVKHLGQGELSERKLLTADNVTQDERGLRKLIATSCYRAAVDLTGVLLTIYGQGYGRAGQPAKHSPHSLQLWFTRLALLSKLGEYEMLQKEAEPFQQLDKPDVYYQFYPEMYPGKVGSIACFSFRLLLAELSLYLGNPSLALDRLADLFIKTKSIRELYAERGDDNAEEFWLRRQTRVLYAVVNCAIAMRRYRIVDDILRDQLLTRPGLTKDERRALFSAWGRIYLQIGDIFGAEQKFAEARRLREINSAPDLRDLVDKGLIHVAKNDFPEAYATFQKALHLESGNTMVLNNMGVCLLYAGKLKEAIHLFEEAIQINPQKSLSENLLVNLSTLYELESNNSKNKKLRLLRLLNRYKPDMKIGVDICLKLQASS